MPKLNLLTNFCFFAEVTQGNFETYFSFFRFSLFLIEFVAERIYKLNADPNLISLNLICWSFNLVNYCKLNHLLTCEGFEFGNNLILFG